MIDRFPKVQGFRYDESIVQELVVILVILKMGAEFPLIENKNRLK